MTTFGLQFAVTQGAFRLNLDVHVEARALALFGPSGSGKTTTLEAIAGLRRPAAGRIAIGGRVLFDSEKRIDVPSRAREVGLVSQDGLLFPHLTVRANVEYGMRQSRGGQTDLYELLDIGQLLARNVSELSGGERQRVALARALNASPRVLLLDEPLAAVDIDRRRDALELLRRVRDELHVPIVLVTHSPEDVEVLADIVVKMRDGVAVDVGPVERNGSERA
jgi:molybdate transport system ATP-binding protein